MPRRPEQTIAYRVYHDGTDMIGVATIDLPLERPLYRPQDRVELQDIVLEEGEAASDASALFNQVYVDLARLRSHIREELRTEDQVTLSHIIERHPLRHGLAELVGYLQIAGHWPKVAVDEEVREEVRWMVEEKDTLPASGISDPAQSPDADTPHEPKGIEARAPVERRALIPRVIFGRS